MATHGLRLAQIQAKSWPIPHFRERPSFRALIAATHARFPTPCPNFIHGGLKCTDSRYPYRRLGIEEKGRRFPDPAERGARVRKFRHRGRPRHAAGAQASRPGNWRLRRVMRPPGAQIPSPGVGDGNAGAGSSTPRFWPPMDIFGQPAFSAE